MNKTLVFGSPLGVGDTDSDSVTAQAICLAGITQAEWCAVHCTAWLVKANWFHFQESTKQGNVTGILMVMQLCRCIKGESPYRCIEGEAPDSGQWGCHSYCCYG